MMRDVKNHTMYESSISDVASYVALSFDKVISARTYDNDGLVIVAILTIPLFSSKERTTLKEQIRSEVAEKLNLDTEQIVVTFDMEIYRLLGNDNIDGDKIIKLAIDRDR